MTSNLAPVNNSPTTQDLLKAAITYRDAFGWSTFPCHDKVPSGKWKRFQNHRATDLELEQLFSQDGVNGFGVFSGSVSGDLAIRDFDDVGSYHLWADQHPDLAKTLPTAESARGFHVYCRGPSLFVKLPNGEYRATPQQFTVTPPSLHPRGFLYRWLVKPDCEIPWVEDPVAAGLLPDILPERIQRSYHKPVEYGEELTPEQHSTAAAYHFMVYGEIKKKANIHRPVKVGQRNSKLLKFVRSIRGLQPYWTDKHLSNAFDLWWGHANGVVGTKDRWVSKYEFFAAFRLCWPEGTRKLDVVHLSQTCSTELLPPQAVNYPDRLQLLVKACAHLQRINGDGSFFLTYADMGRLVEATSSWAQSAVTRLIHDRILFRLSTGNNLNGRASTYTYLPNPRAKTTQTHSIISSP